MTLNNPPPPNTTLLVSRNHLNPFLLRQGPPSGGIFV